MNPFKLLTTPEYFWKPSQVWHRVKQVGRPAPPRSAVVTLPWGDRIEVRPRETVGASIWYYGVFDLVVTEAIARLLDPGETALDIGGNIGQMTSLMRHVAGPRGSVHTFEPHPELCQAIHQLLHQAREAGGVAPVQLHQLGLSDSEGAGRLVLSQGWHENRGIGRVAPGERTDSTQESVPVRLRRLDDVLPAGSRIGVCKIDVEGHEMAVFRGASRLFQERAVRDVVFEELSPYPAPLHQFLAAQGYRIYGLHSRVTRPLLRDAAVPASRTGTRPVENYLATLDPARAEQRYRKAGWQSLKRIVR